jgi:hypothetical protein
LKLQEYQPKFRLRSTMLDSNNGFRSASKTSIRTRKRENRGVAHPEVTVLAKIFRFGDDENVGRGRSMLGVHGTRAGKTT